MDTDEQQTNRVAVRSWTTPPCHDDDPWGVTPEKIQSAVEGIVKIGNPRRVILFGSAAQGSVHQDSDADFLVIVGNQIQNARSESTRLRHAIRNIRMPIDIIVITEQRLEELGDVYGLVYREALERGIVVHDAIP
ncbi:MAG: nucleotidyltransferase domain-containing protein [Chloroflexota bacterium]